MLKSSLDTASPSWFPTMNPYKHSHPNGGRADTVTRDFSIMMRPAWLKTVTRLGLNKFSLMHYGLYKGNPTML